MTPNEVSSHLHAIANYIEQEDSPEIGRVSNAIQGILAAMAPRQAGDLKRFLNRDIDAVKSSLDNLLSRVKKVVRTLNPQDESAAYLSQVVKEWTKIRHDLEFQLEDFENVSI